MTVGMLDTMNDPKPLDNRDQSTPDPRTDIQEPQTPDGGPIEAPKPPEDPDPYPVTDPPLDPDTAPVPVEDPLPRFLEQNPGGLPAMIF